MLKLLLLACAAALYAYLRGRARRPEAPPAPRTEDMVRCAHCGLHVPARESVRDGDLAFCCEDHRRRHRP